MKKILLFAAAAIMMVGCSKDQVVSEMPQDNAINFGMYFGRDAQSRAAIMDLDDLKAQSFGVFAYYTNDGVYAEGTSTPNFMFNQIVKWNGTDAWTYSPLKYWPNEVADRLSFFAYAPHTTQEPTGSIELAGFTNTTASAPVLKYTLADNLADHVDLLWATPVKDQTTNGVDQTINGKVKFTFNHALSRIGFKAVAVIDEINGENTGDVDTKDHATEVAPGTTITIDEIVLTGNFHQGGVLSLENGTWTSKVTPDAETYTWGASELLPNPVTHEKKVVINDDSYLTVIPQLNDGTQDLKIKVTYTVTTEDAALTGGESVVQSTVTSDEFDFTFEQGFAYNFVLHIGLTSVKFTADVAPWDPATETDIVVNVPLND